MIISLLLSSKLLLSDIYTFSTDNDIVFNSDNGYTAALFFAWMGDEYKQAEKDSFTYYYTSTLSNLVNYLPYVSLDGKKLNASISLQEMIVTPTDLNSTEPNTDDVAYSGTLGLHFSIYAWDAQEFDQFRISTGVVGPLSGAEQIQTYIHKITGSTEPKGWDNQLDNHFVLNFGYLKGYKSYTKKLGSNVRLEWFNSGFADFGNYYVGAGGGTLLRLGQNMPYNFDTLSALMSATSTNQINFQSRNNKLGWAISMGVYANYIAYLYNIEANKKNGIKKDISEITNAKVLTAKVSINLFYENLETSFEIYPTRTEYDSSNAASWGRINFTWYFD